MSPRSHVPGAPQSVALTPGVGGIAVSWEPPLDSGGASIVGYRLQRSFDGLIWSTAVSHSRSFATSAFVPLADRRSVFVRVAAWNESGLGAYSSASASSGAASIRPGVPEGVAATPGPSRIVVTWSEPADDGGTEITGYRIQRSLDGITWVTTRTVLGNARQATMAVTGGRAYLVRVAGLNAAGISDNSTPVGPVTPTTVAGPPPSVHVQFTGARADLSWSQPVTDGGSSVTGYRIQRSVDGLNWVTLVSHTRSTGVSFMDRSAMSADAGYTYRVAAWNASGLGPNSPAS
jgi:hypothetical protein